jgi:hypothetical protein
MGAASWQSGRREVREDEKTKMRSHELNLTWGIRDARHMQNVLEAKTGDLAFVLGPTFRVAGTFCSSPFQG